MPRRAIGLAAAGVTVLAVAGIGVIISEPDSGETQRALPTSPTSHTATPTPEPTPTPTPTADDTVLVGATALDVSGLDVSGLDVSGLVQVEDLLAPILTGNGLGDRVGVVVADLGTGETLYARAPDRPMIPASTVKILTGAAVLEALGPAWSFRTRVLSVPGSGELILVGGGDPTLTADDRPRMPEAARLADLADETADALLGAGRSTVTLRVDDSLFGGPSIDPDWRASYVPDGVVGPVSALSVDGGRTTPRLRSRAVDPAIEAGKAFARMLSERGVMVQGSVERATTPDGAIQLAVLTSAPVSAAVEFMLAVSDNDIAEVLARHVARGSGLPATSEAAGAAVADVISSLGTDLAGAAILDGSGLARDTMVAPSAIADVLIASADPQRPHLRSVLSGLPVAGFTGTLGSRFTSPDAVVGRGYVRAKTGTLTGVTSLAGIAAADDGSTYVFALMADRIVDTLGARQAMDEAASALATCGCAHPGAARAPGAQSGGPDTEPSGPASSRTVAS